MSPSGTDPLQPPAVSSEADPPRGVPSCPGPGHLERRAGGVRQLLHQGYRAPGVDGQVLPIYEASGVLRR